jgi:hypothetical protein
LNGFAKEQDVINAKKQIGGCIRTFFAHGKLKTSNSPWCMAKQHQTTLGGQDCKCHIGVKIGMHNTSTIQPRCHLLR